MITRMDRDIGRLAALIHSRGIARHTLILFTSDNGPHREGGANPAYFNSSGGLRGIKRDLYEGGVRVPMIAWWPGTLPAGRISNHVFAHWDIHPTLAEIAGARVASHLDGVSKVRVLKGKSQAQSDFLYWEFHEGGFKQAVRMGKWKGIRLAKEAPLELYDIQNDPTEQHNIAATNPHIVARIENYLKGARTESSQWPVK
jgi:arylsulfatase A-like enzyme